MPETEYSPSFLLPTFLFLSIHLSIHLSVRPSSPSPVAHLRAFLLPSFCLFVCLCLSGFLCVYVCQAVCLSICMSVCPSFLQRQCMLKVASSTFTSRCIISSSTQQSFVVLSEQVLGRKILVGISMNLLKVRFIMRKLMNGQRHARHVAIN